ncbi:hypothetical protein [Saprospira grandis]|uniref:Uncharacterized protein n=1 Tax=Saprospira grandis (strain Lewin) TaxID=984262 RepID=H6L6L1_SAPGL|nr:hypothetical protein [Saprospira grandis]AFC25257.1 hypothetical protein SGRA_2529 [Saprospira grandis str. Lewin]
MGKKKYQNSVDKTLLECEAMIDHALAEGKKLPPGLLASLKKFKLYQDYLENGPVSDGSRNANGSHPFLEYSRRQTLGGMAHRSAQAEELHVPSQEDMINQLSMVHEDLTAAVYPAQPSSIVLLEEQKKSAFRFLGPIPLIQRMTFVAIIALLTFLGLFMFEEVDARSVNGNILDYETPMKFLLNQLFILAIAAAGASFYALFEAYKYISNASFDAKYESMYWIRFILGIVSGVILAQFIFIDPTVYGGDASEVANSAQSLGGFITYKPILAFLGGFSARVVHKILTSLIESLETFISGSARDMVRAREEAAKLQMEERLANVKRENSVNQASQRFEAALKLLELQRKLEKTEDAQQVNSQLQAMINDELANVQSATGANIPNSFVAPTENEFANMPTTNEEYNFNPEDMPADLDVMPGDIPVPVEMEESRDEFPPMPEELPEIPEYPEELPEIPEYPENFGEELPPLDLDQDEEFKDLDDPEGLNEIDQDIPLDPPPFKD